MSWNTHNGYPEIPSSEVSVSDGETLEPALLEQPAELLPHLITVRVQHGGQPAGVQRKLLVRVRRQRPAGEQRDMLLLSLQLRRKLIVSWDRVRAGGEERTDSSSASSWSSRPREAVVSHSFAMASSPSCFAPRISSTMERKSPATSLACIGTLVASGVCLAELVVEREGRFVPTGEESWLVKGGVQNWRPSGIPKGSSDLPASHPEPESGPRSKSHR